MRKNFVSDLGNTSKHIGHSSSSSSCCVVVDDEVDFLSLSFCGVDVFDDVSKEVLHLMKTIATGKLLKRICTLSPDTIEQMMIKAGAKKSDRGRGELNLKRDKLLVFL